MGELTSWLTAAVAAALAAALLSLLTALLERSGPIRLRFWAEESGGAIQRLYERAGTFEGFRFLLTLFARLALLACYAAVAMTFVLLGIRGALFLGALPVLVLLAAVEAANRHLVARFPEEGLRVLTPAYRALRRLLSPLSPLVGALMPDVREDEEEEDDEDEEEEEVTRGEVEAYIDLGRREGILEEGEEDLVRGVVRFGDTQVRSVMTPRVDMIGAPVTTPLEELVELFLASGHSRLPLYGDSTDEVLGILHVRDLLRLVAHPGSGTTRSVLQPVHFVPETKSLAQLLRELQERHQEMAVVVDEYGGTGGVVTVEDLLEEIFGEFADEHDPSRGAPVRLDGGAWRVDGRTHLGELGEMLGVPIDDDSYETVGGLVFGTLGHVPKVGDAVTAYGLRFIVEGADPRRARRVRVEPMPAPEPGGTG